MVTKDTAEVAEDMLAKTKKSVEHNLTKASEVASLARKEFDMGECTSKTRRRFGPKLATLQAERTTYTIDPTHADYASYRESFVADDKTAEITELLDAVPAMGAMHRELVPEVVAYRDFWARYFFQAEPIAAQEARKNKLLQREVFDDDEEFVWDEDEDASDASVLPETAVAHSSIHGNAAEAACEPPAARSVSAGSAAVSVVSARVGPAESTASSQEGVENVNVGEKPLAAMDARAQQAAADAETKASTGETCVRVTCENTTGEDDAAHKKTGDVESTVHRQAWERPAAAAAAVVPSATPVGVDAAVLDASEGSGRSASSEASAVAGTGDGSVGAKADAAGKVVSPEAVQVEEPMSVSVAESSSSATLVPSADDDWADWE